MKPSPILLHPLLLALILSSAVVLPAQDQRNPAPRPGGPPPAGQFPPPGGPGFDGPPPFDAPMPFQPGGAGGPGGPGGMGGFGPNAPEIELVAKFDQNADGWLNAEERKAARLYLAEQGGNRRGPGGRRGGFGPRGGEAVETQPGAKVKPADVANYPDAPLYASNVLRTFFLEFESPDWEKELAEFKNTDVEVPAKLTVDGKVYPDVGVHFHGASSFMMLGEGQKRSLTVTLDFIHKNQNVGGYTKLNLLNAHGDPSFLRSVLSLQIARDYLPAAQANHARVVINGESWGIYVSQQHINKEFLKENFATPKGTRWKVPGSPNGRGGLEYLGNDPAAYQRLYEIKTKDEPAAWAALIRLTKVLNETPTDQLEAALSPLLDLDQTLKFLAWDNVLANADGYWTRASDYHLYLDPKGRFHLLPYDSNETFSLGGGPGGGMGGPGGGRGGPGGGMPAPGAFLAPQVLAQADRNADDRITQAEFTGLAEKWFGELDADGAGKVDEDKFMAGLPQLLPPPPGFGPQGGDQGQRGQGAGGQRPGQFGRPMQVPFVGPVLFRNLDADHDGSLTREEFQKTFARWFTEWDKDKRGTLDEASLGAGLSTLLPAPDFGGPGGAQGGVAGGRGRGGAGGGPGGGRGPRGGPELDPLAVASDASKPMLSKLLAVPALRERYLGYVREMAEKWLDWQRLGPLAQQYHELIAAEVKADTRKLSRTEDFDRSIGSDGRNSLKSFADQRRTYLLAHPEIKKLKP